jgi:hypothetical protein
MAHNPEDIKMALENCIVRVGGSRWKIRQAMSCKAALNEISFARCTGSVGGKSSITLAGGETTVIAEVVKVNSDNTERQPYSAAY